MVNISDEQNTALHAIYHLRWAREGSETFEVQRARLLDRVTQLLERMTNNPRLHVLLDGQTVLLEDVAGVRPDLVTLLVIYNAGGRLGIGPWYVRVDEALVSGESLVRNLLMGRASAQQYGMNTLPAAYSPGLYGHVAQLPQILRGFGIDAAFLPHGAPLPHAPFRWEGPDGSAVLVVNDTSLEAHTLSETLEDQRAAEPNGPFLWVHDALEDVSPPANAAVTLTDSSLPAYFKALRQQTPDSARPALKGELRLQGLREHAYLLPGTLSTRMHLKQASGRMQALLTYTAEPLLALALTHGKPAFADNLRAMLNHSWRLLLKNQAYTALNGTSCDAAHREHEIRSQHAEDSAAQVIDGALRALPGRFNPAAPSDLQTYIVVWNPNNWEVDQVVQAPLKIPPGTHPLELVSPDGADVIFSWALTDTPENGPVCGVLSFKCAVQPVGYAAFTLKLSDTEAYVYAVRTTGTRIHAVPDPVVLAVEDGKLITRVVEPPVYDVNGDVVRPANEQELIVDMLRFFDGGDAGDVYTYDPPAADAIIAADLLSDVQQESGALYQRLILRHRLRVAPSLRPDRSRGRGVKLIELTTTATMYDYMPGVYFRTTFENTASDHRLRAHLRTGIHSDEVLAKSAFGVVTRKIREDGALYPTGPNREGIAHTYPMSGLCAVQDETSGMALLARGLTEFEAISEDGQVTLALTLLRAVGWRGRSDLRTRTAALSPLLAVPEAQMQRTMSAEYALIPVWRNDPTLMRMEREYNAPLQAFQYSQPPDVKAYSYLNIEDNGGLILTALKPPQTGKGWIVRLFNPTQQVIEARVIPNGKLSAVEVVNLAEETQSALPVEQNSVQISVEPHKIITLRLLF